MANNKLCNPRLVWSADELPPESIPDSIKTRLKAQGLDFVRPPPLRLPVLLGASGIEWLPTLYLLEVASTSVSNSFDTLRTYAEHALEWARFLYSHGESFETVSGEHLLAYRNAMYRTQSARTGKRLGGRTINARTFAVRRMYAWAAQQGLTKSKLSDSFLVRSRHDTTRREIKGASLHVRVIEKIPRILTADQARRVTGELEPTEALMARWMLSTGIRRKEICDLDLHDIPNVSDTDPRDVPLVQISLRRKGGSQGQITAPFLLVEETNWFRELHRRPTKRSLEQEPLFVSKQGRRFNPDYLGSVLRKAGLKVNVDLSPHVLRHTYAVTLLALLQKASARGAEINPIKVLQVLLGHRNIETTAIYLRAIEVHSEEVASALEYLYGAQLEADATLPAWVAELSSSR